VGRRFVAAVAETIAREGLSEDEVRRLAWLAKDAQLAREGPVPLLKRMRCFDQREAREFRFNMTDPDGGWFWQRELVDWWMGDGNLRSIVLKGRQIGVTWLATGVAVWKMLYDPGSLVLVYRQKEDEAAELVGRAWDMLQSLDPLLWNRAKVLTPRNAPRPHTEIELVFPDGRVSTMKGMTSSSSSGHGKTAALVILDEFARVDRAQDIMAAVSAVAGQTGRVIVVSTANGRSNELTGEGNFFHYLWTSAAESGLSRKFLSWRSHPGRDDEWYRTSPEVLMLRPWQRAEQYPDNPEEAFSLSSAVFFDQDALGFYMGGHVGAPELRGDFRLAGSDRKARFAETGQGQVAVYRKPDPGHGYVVGVDVATGRGLDFTTGYVVDLTDMAVCAEYRAKADPDESAEQLYWLGVWFEKAEIMVESQGGYGLTIINPLRDGRAGRPPYPRLYRHRDFRRGDQHEALAWGFPMSSATRPQILSYMEEAVRERQLPWLTSSLVDEMGSFIRFDPAKPSSRGPWPRAQDGCHDDCVMALAIALEGYRQKGHHGRKTAMRSTRKKQVYKPWYAWEPAARRELTAV